MRDIKSFPHLGGWVHPSALYGRTFPRVLLLREKVFELRSNKNVFMNFIINGLETFLYNMYVLSCNQ
jgi:hypothetical protein